LDNFQDMFYLFISDIVVLLHFGFVLYVIFGGFLLFKWPKSIWVHIPAVIWGSVVEIFNITCPLTILENLFRYKAGTGTYEADFIGEYILPILYPDGLTREIQLILGIAVIIGNSLIYYFVFRKRKASNQEPPLL